VSFTIIMAGGVQRRAAGWKVISSLLLFSALVECIGMGLMVCVGGCKIYPSQSGLVLLRHAR
jgi:hypothetical protein